MRTLIKAGLRSHRGTLLGVAALLALVALSLCTVLTVWLGSQRYVRGEMARLGYGDLTAWVSGLVDAQPLAAELAALDEVASVGVQPLIFSEYEVGEQESDSEGQLITYEPELYPYRFFSDDFSGYGSAPATIASGEVYAPASMASMFGLHAGDEIAFPIARSGVDAVFTVAGFFEDPFMGSSMIGMKGFLIGAEDHARIAAVIAQEGVDALAREGFMLHIRQSGDLSAAALGALLNERTSLQRYAEFTHSAAAISGFMLTLQNVFTSLLLAFVLILLLASAAVVSHSVGSAIEQDRADLGILKAMGFTGARLRRTQLGQYGFAAACGMAAGTLLALPASKLVCRMTVTTTGLLIPANMPSAICLAALALILLLLLGFVWLRTRRIARISPLAAIRGDQQASARHGRA